MRAIVLCNDVGELPPTMTTARIAVAAANLGVETHIATIGALGIDIDDAVTVRSRRAPASLEAMGDLPRAPTAALRLDADDVVLVRLNPARLASPAQVPHTLYVLRLLARRGVRVVNSADSIERTATKAFLSELPAELRPAQAVAADLDTAVAAIAKLGPEVFLKPARGSRGSGVLAVDTRHTNPRPLVELLLERGAVVIQARLETPDGADKRVVVVDGAPLVVEGEPVVVRRVPAEGEHRSNLHAGGTAERTTLSAAEHATLDGLRPHLLSAGLRVVGVDLLADRVLELNVWAPGGLGPFARVTGIDASRALTAALLGL